MARTMSADTSQVEVPPRMEDLLGYTVHKHRWEPAVRWHPVWNVPRAPRKLPESVSEPSSLPPKPARVPPIPSEHPPPHGAFISGPGCGDPFMLGGPMNGSIMPPHAMQPFPGMPPLPGMGPPGMLPVMGPTSMQPDPFMMGDWGKGGASRRGKGGGLMHMGMKGRGGPYPHQGQGKGVGKGKGKGGGGPAMG